MTQTKPEPDDEKTEEIEWINLGDDFQKWKLFLPSIEEESSRFSYWVSETCEENEFADDSTTAPPPENRD